MFDQLRKIALENGISLFGIANIEKSKDEILCKDIPGVEYKIFDKFNNAISIGYRLSTAVLSTLIDGPNQIYFFHYQRINIFLDTVALQIANFIQSAGYEAFPVPSSQIVDWKNNRGLISHRRIAELAGLGFRGINNLVVNPKYGAQVRYATILTNLPSSVEKKQNLQREEESYCNSCRACIDVCPAGAIGKTAQEFKLDLCISKLKEFQKQRSISALICGLCVKVCSGKNY